MRNFLLCLAFLFCQHILIAQQIPCEIIVQLEKDFSPKQIEQHFSSNPAEARLLSKSWNIWLLHVPPGDEESFFKAIRKNPQVKTAQYNHRVSKRFALPNDTLFPNQWNLENTGQLGGAPDADIDAPEAWQLATGSVTALGDTIVIAIVDEGVDLNHEDLRFWKNKNDLHNGIDDDLNGYIDDYHGWNAGNHSDSVPPDFHGTHVAGIACAVGNNNLGIAGVSWGAQILPVCITDYTEAQVVEAYSYIFDIRKLYNETGGAEGAFIVAANSSFGIDFGKPEDYPVWCAMYDSLGSAGVLSVASTMNLNADVDISGDIPSTCTSDYLIVVTGTTRFDVKNTSAAIGYASVDLGAPGTAIFSTVPGNGYVNSSGTSMAAPHVAGAVALLYSGACPDFLQQHNSPDSIALIVKNYILKGTDILPSLDGLTVSGGRLNLFNSLHEFYNDNCVTCAQFNSAVENIPCHGGQNGMISLTASNGTPPYSYTWSNGDSSASITGLPRGKYFVKVSDTSGCEKYDYFEITQPFPLVVNVISDSAVNGENGSVAAYVSGGISPYTYLWNDSLFSATAVVQDLSPGIYSVTVTDANGCIAVKTATVGNITGIGSSPGNLFEATAHPNPVSGILWIEFPTNNSRATPVLLSVYSASGSLVLAKKTSELKPALDFSGIPQGIYFLKFQSSAAVGIKKIIRL